ncbi:phosphoglycerate kinase, cytosolic-like isoform X2 [Syzygium oleosum]|uniref:phosphoglycerate kinase, cytosolic-like isoform X2 n=1 Tax=Syzygium oleosum TaxID=219896 RepID=UPI0011D24C69|nr:phosphoglycerate kinase, cytosolic-like isoform X2 [Syzygium oleosum]
MMSMSQLLHPLGAILFFNNARDPRGRVFKWVPPKSGSYVSINAVFSRLFVGARSSSHGDFPPAGSNETSAKHKAFFRERGESDALPYIQTLGKFPKEELEDKVVMVRFDSAILLREDQDHTVQSNFYAHLTIKYLLEARARIVLVSDWNDGINSKFPDLQSVAEHLSLVLGVNVVPSHCLSHYSPPTEALEMVKVLLLENLSEFKEEVCNSLEFAETLSSGVDIFVNESFSQSHKVLASTVGVTRFCYSSIAGFHFEESLRKLKDVVENDKRPHIAIIGGTNLSNKAAALCSLASVCDGLVFVGMMSFQIMHALGLLVPINHLELGATKAASELVQVAQDRNIPILYPKDFWCLNENVPNQLELFPAHAISKGWMPVDIGPRTLDEIKTLLKKSKKATWTGPVKFKSRHSSAIGASKLACILNAKSQGDCDVTIVGSVACKTMTDESSSIPAFSVIENASVWWDFLKGRKLPGVMALDRAYALEVDWKSVYSEPAQPLVVDIGSGNGLFLLGMAKRWEHLNFLGLEINEKLVRRCLIAVHQSNLKNGYFIATNATSTFCSIVSSYPGDVILVSIQCPNPDFNKPEHRWRMLQKSLVEAVADLLIPNGKVFLQSDVEAVAVRMKEQFLRYGKGKLSISQAQDTTINRGWLEENPFGIRSDWEQHVLDRGAPMYRLMLLKSNNEQ